MNIGREAAESTFSQIARVGLDIAPLAYLLVCVVIFGIIFYRLNWFFSAIERIEKSLREIEKKLESRTTERTNQP